MPVKTIASIYLLFTVSGFIGLIYQSLWSQYLKLFLGHASYGNILTLCLFMGGLGVGSFIAGNMSQRSKNPLQMYAVIELLIGLGAWLYHPVYEAATGSFYQNSALLVEMPWVLEASKVVIASLITLPIAVLLGMTFPALTVGVMRLCQDEGQRSIPWLYFTNSLGAALGALASSYLFIPEYGTIGTLRIAGTSNFVIGIIFILVAEALVEQVKPSEVEAKKPSKEPVFEDTGVGRYWIHLLLMVSMFTGLSSFIYEISWIRLLSLLLGSSTHSFDIMVSSFILGLASGGLFARFLLSKVRDSFFALALIQILMGLSAVFSIHYYESSFHIANEFHSIFQRSVEAYPFVSASKYLLAFSLMFPISFFAGMTFPFITYLLTKYTQDEKYVGWVYGWNTIGSILGTVMAGLFLIPLLQLKNTVMVAAVIDVALGVGLLWLARSQNAWKFAWSVAGVLLIIPGFYVEWETLITTSGVYRNKKDFDFQRKVSVRDGKMATVSIRETDRVITLAINGKPDASLSKDGTLHGTDELTQMGLALLPMGALQEPYDAAMIGFGSGMTAHYLLADPLLKSLDVLEIEPEVREMSKAFLPRNKRAYEDRRADTIFQDALTYFYSNHKKYDLIISEPSNPWVSGVANLFTTEFYQHAERNLTSEGILCQWMHLYEFNSDLMLSIIKSLHSVFEYVEIFKVPDMQDIVILASQSPFEAAQYERLIENEDLQSDLSELRKNLQDFGYHTYWTSGKTLAPAMKYVESNSMYKPYVDAHAEKAFFLRTRVRLFDGFQSLFNPYPHILNPERYQDVLAEKVLFNASNTELPPHNQRVQLYNLLLEADESSDWEAITDLFFEVTTSYLETGYWYESEEVKLFHELVVEEVVPFEYQLWYLLLNGVMYQDRELLSKVNRLLLEEHGPGELTHFFIHAMLLGSIMSYDQEVYQYVVQKLAVPDYDISQYEKDIMIALVNHPYWDSPPLPEVKGTEPGIE